MAEATVVPEAAAIALPDGVDPAVAALIGCCVTTGVGAVLKTAAGAGRRERGGHRARWRRAVVRHGRGAGRRRADRGGRPGRGQAGRRRATLGATDGLLATDDRAATVEALRDLTDGGPDFVFEAIGRPATVELAIEALPLGGTAVLVGMTPLETRASFAVYPFVDGSRRILGSNYGFADPPVDFPRYAALHLAGRLPIERLIDRRIGLDDLEAAFDRLRDGVGLRQVIDFEPASADGAAAQR